MNKTMALSSNFLRRIVGGGRSIECRKSFMRLTSTLTSPKLFISGVSPSTTDEKIREVFSPFGNLREAKVIKDRASGISMGLATVTYDTVEEAERARKRMDYTLFGGYVIFVESEFEFFKQKYEHPPKSFFRVYVDLDDLDEYEGVLDLTTGDKLRAAFAPFGNVLEVRICKGGPYGNSKGTAIIKYGTKEEAEKAHDALEDNLLGHK